MDTMGEQEECKPCKVAVALGMAINICREIDGKETCDDLFNKVTKEEISPKELFEIVKKKAKDKPDQLDLINYIESLAGDLEVEE